MKHKILILFGVIVVLGMALRVAHMGKLHSVEADEYSWLFAGQSLLETGVPTSWTIEWPYYDWSKYEKKVHKQIGQNTYLLVTPWLDHPPLFSLGMGAWAKIAQTHIIPRTEWTLLRWPMIGIALIAMLATITLAYRLGGKTYALFTAGAYAAFPAAALTSPFIMAENAVGAWFVTSLLAVHIAVWSKVEKYRYFARIALLILAATAPWLKISGIVVPAAAVFVLLLWKQYRLAAKIAVITAVSVSAFVTYGWAYNWDIFLGAQRTHAMRPQSFQNMWSWFYQSEVARIRITDPSIVVGFIGALLMAAQGSRKVQPLLTAALLAGVGIMLLVAPVESYSWYKFPLFPVVALGLGWVLYQFYRGQIVFAVLVLPLLAYIGEQAHPALSEHSKAFLLGITLLLSIWMIIPPHFVLLRRVIVGCLITLLLSLEAMWVWNVGSG